MFSWELAVLCLDSLAILKESSAYHFGQFSTRMTQNVRMKIVPVFLLAELRDKVEDTRKRGTVSIILVTLVTIMIRQVSATKTYFLRGPVRGKISKPLLSSCILINLGCLIHAFGMTFLRWIFVPSTCPANPSPRSR